jgi:dihydropteroate synthase
MVVRIIEIKNKEQALREFRNVKADEKSFQFMLPKVFGLNIKIREVKARDANIIKQEMLSDGGDAALSRESYDLKDERSDILLMGNLRSYSETIKKLKLQPIKELRKIAGDAEGGIRNYFSVPECFEVNGKRFDFSRPLVMGILNVTPDSFSDGGKFYGEGKAAEGARRMIEEGADIIDVGGESTRPGHKSVSFEEEEKRVIPVIERLRDEVEKPVSIDTTKLEIAEKALKLGVEVVNDQWGLQMKGRDNKGFAKLIADHDAALVLMHNRDNNRYGDLMYELLCFLEQGIRIAENNGVDPRKIIVDPGVGFGKDVEQNLRVLARVRELKVLGKPILIGPSRKSFIGKTLGLEVEDRLEGSLATIAYAMGQGVNVVRMHQVKESVRVAKLMNALMEAC